MRNLKKVLSLALATVMLLGMMVMGAGAVTTTKDYADGSTVTYKEAVDVMSAIGVFDGTSGSFNPTGNVTRAQAAKIITYMLLGREVAEKLGTLNAPYKDVPASHWAAGSIAYCTNLGIVGGYGNGYFKPDGQVTGYEFAKMLLTALGYDAEREKMTGKDWSTAVARLAITNALDLGVDSAGSSIVLSNALTREEACQMAFNTIKAPMVDYSNTVGSITTPDGTVVNLGGSTASIIYDNVHSYAGNIDREINTSSGRGNVLQFGERYFQTLLKTGDTDDFGRPARTWTIGREDIGTYASSYALVYTAEVSKSSMKSNLSGYTYITGGAPIITNGRATGSVATSDNIADLTGNGVAVEIYTGSGQDSREIQKVVVINTYMMSIRRINSENVTLARFTGTNSVSGPVVGAVDKDDATYSALSAMKAGDYVLVTPVTTDEGENYSVASVAVPTTQSGALTRIDKKTNNDNVTTKVTVGGTSYSVAKNQANNNNDPLVEMNTLSVGSVSTSANSVVYLDTYGYAVAIRDVGNTTNYMYVFRKYQSLTSDGQLVTMVQGVAPDGTIVTVNVGTGVSNTTKYLDFARNSLVKQLVSYTPSPSNEANTNSSEYVLEAQASSGLTNETVNAGATKLDNNYFASNVKFIYVDSDNTIYVRDGVRAGTITTGAKLVQNNLVTAVFVQGAPNDADPSKIVYLSAFKGWQDQSKGQAIYEAYFEGAKQEIVIKTNDITKRGFYSFSLDETTNLYSVGSTNYSGAGTSARALSNQTVANIIDDRLIDLGSVVLNAASAEVIDLSDNKISTVGDIYDKMYDINGVKVNTITVSVLYNDSNDSGKNTVAYIYVLDAKSTDNTVTATIGTNSFNFGAATNATTNVTVGNSVTVTLGNVSGKTVTEATSSDASIATVTNGNTDHTSFTINGVAAGSATITFTVQAADGSSPVTYTITATVAASAG